MIHREGLDRQALVVLVRAALEWRRCKAAHGAWANAKRRFSYRLAKLGLDPVTELQVHVQVVEIADFFLEVER